MLQSTAYLARMIEQPLLLMWWTLEQHLSKMMMDLINTRCQCCPWQHA
jgi:hypothetical protein